MYCTKEDLRAEGVTEAQASDARLTELIGLATDYIDAMTGRWFEPRTKTMVLDGNGCCTLMLPVFLIAATSVKVDGEAVTGYKIYNRFNPDDRDAPAIYHEDTWPEGVQNIEIAGSWGYVDPGAEAGQYVTPPRIKRCCMRLVIRDLPLLNDQAGQEDRRRSRIVSESTDGHSYTLKRLAMFPELTGDLDIDEVLSYYRRPCRVELV
ncbi:MAG: hypothetical protein ACM3X6_02855 [Patescibacteria group bacterium]